MSERKLVCVVAGVVVALGLVLALGRPAVADAPQPELIVPYEPSPPPVVEAMLKLAKVGPDDVVYDLGCGDGRIVCMAVNPKMKFGAKRAVGIDLDPERLKEAKENAEQQGVADKIKYIAGNFLDANLKDATVVAIYLLPNVDLMVRPIMFRDMKPGTRIVSHAFPMGDWEQDDLVHPKRARNNVVYLWYIPASVGGIWEWSSKVKEADVPATLKLDQEFQFVRGFLTFQGEEPVRVTDQVLKGADLTFTVKEKDGKTVRAVFSGTVEGETIKGTQKWGSAAEQPWTAKRQPADLTGSWRVEIKPTERMLDGTLKIEKKENGILGATFALDKDKRPIPATLYVWGTSLRFELPAERTTVDFKGVLWGDKGGGSVNSEGWPNDLPWTAAKAK